MILLALKTLNDEDHTLLENEAGGHLGSHVCLWESGKVEMSWYIHV